MEVRVVRYCLLWVISGVSLLFGVSADPHGTLSGVDSHWWNTRDGHVELLKLRADRTQVDNSTETYTYHKNSPSCLKLLT